VQNVKFSRFCFLVFLTHYNALTTTVVLLHLLLSLHGPFRNSRSRFHCICKVVNQSHLMHRMFLMTLQFNWLVCEVSQLQLHNHSLWLHTHPHFAVGLLLACYVLRCMCCCNFPCNSLHILLISVGFFNSCFCSVSVDFDVTGQLLIIYSVLIKYLRKSGNTKGQDINYLQTAGKPMIQLGGTSYTKI
jgi:hypothetical protein